MISFDIIRSGKAIQIEVDDDGIRLLIDQLHGLLGSGSHVHLHAPSHGGTVLSDETPGGKKAINEVIISHGGD